MHFARKALATSVIAASCAIPGALLLSATASADPLPAPAPALPAMPNIPFLSALTPGNAPQLLQGLASAFTGTAATPAAAAPAPAATASLTLPQAPATSAVAPLAAAPAPAAAGLVPTAEVQLPQVANNALPLPKELTFPGDLASLLPAGLPLANLLPKSPSAVPVAAAAIPAATAVPVVAAPAATGLDALSPLLFPVAGLP